MHSLTLYWSEWDILNLESVLCDILYKNDEMVLKILEPVGKIPHYCKQNSWVTIGSAEGVLWWACWPTRAVLYVGDDGD